MYIRGRLVVENAIAVEDQMYDSHPLLLLPAVGAVHSRLQPPAAGAAVFECPGEPVLR